MSEASELGRAIADAISAKATPSQTSIDSYRPAEVTVRFRRWTAFNGTAYMRHQEAGFARHQIAELERQGIVDIVHVTPRELSPKVMVRK